MRQNRLLASLPDDEKERLNPYLEPVELELRQMLLETGAPINYVWFPDTCITSTLVTAPMVR